MVSSSAKTRIYVYVCALCTLGFSVFADEVDQALQQIASEVAFALAEDSFFAPLLLPFLPGDAPSNSAVKEHCSIHELKQLIKFDDNNLPPLHGYDKIEVNVEDYEFVGEDGPEDSTAFRYKSTGPVNSLGVFTLQNQTDSVTSLVSFANTDEAITTTAFTATEEDNEYFYRIRVHGDRNWSFGDDNLNPFTGVIIYQNLFDPIYNFKLLEGDINNPTKFAIEVDFAIPFKWPQKRISIKGCLGSLLALNYTLVTDPNDPEKQRYPNSVVWLRESTTLGNPGTSFYATQVVDGNGNRLQPAYDDWLLYQSTRETSPGVNYYWDLKTKWHQ